jgi:protein-tyrosine phosphatase
VSSTFSVVFICTGNRFRSPIAAAVFAAATVGAPVRVQSVGTIESSGAPVLPEALRAGSLYGLDLAAHRSQPLGAVKLHDADLVIGFERTHIARAVVDGGAPPERSFLAGELVNALERRPFPDSDDVVERARNAVRLAANRRSDGSWAVADPLGGPPHVYEETADRVRGLALRLAQLLFGSSRD